MAALWASATMHYNQVNLIILVRLCCVLGLFMLFNCGLDNFLYIWPSAQDRLCLNKAQT